MDLKEKKVLKKTIKKPGINKQLLPPITDIIRKTDLLSSHFFNNLWSPLRAIDGYTSILEEDFGYRLNPEGKRLIGVVRENAGKMRSLLENFETYSQLGKQEVNKLSINVMALAKSILNNLEHAEKKVRFNINTLHSCNGDPGLIKKVLTILISNAVRLSSGNNKPVVELKSKKEKNRIVYAVYYDDPGLEQKAANKLSDLFCVPHSTDEFEMFGADLALAEKIVSAHGGKIWTKGLPGKGAVFYFSIPVN